MDQSRKQQPGRSRVRYFYEEILSKKLNVNLADGMEKFVRKEREEGIDQILQFIMSIATPNSSLRKTIHECDFVVWRGTLTRLMTSPYENSEYAVGIKVACIKYRGVYFINEFDTQTKKNNEACLTDYQKRMTYGGFKFEQIVTVDDINQKPDTKAPVDQNNEFIGIFKTTLNQTSSSNANLTNANGIPTNNRSDAPSICLLYGAEIDCISPLGEFMEVKTQFDKWGCGKGFPNKALKWWIQSYLVGIRQMVIGYQKNCILNRVDVAKVEWLSQAINESGRSVKVCFDFLHCFLQNVRRLLDTLPAGTILVAERLPTSHDFNFVTIEPNSDTEGSAEQYREYQVLSEAFMAYGWR